jgi:hypothetical protein
MSEVTEISPYGSHFHIFFGANLHLICFSCATSRPCCFQTGMKHCFRSCKTLWQRCCCPPRSDGSASVIQG